MTGLASRKITTAALVTGALAVGLLAPTAAGAVAPGHDHDHGRTTTVVRSTVTATAPATTKAAAPYVRGKVVSAVPLRIRSRATTASAALGTVAPNTVVKLACKVRGQNIAGNDIWYNLATRPGWVAARFVRNLAAVPFC